jgi:hypothetical protein
MQSQFRKDVAELKESLEQALEGAASETKRRQQTLDVTRAERAELLHEEIGRLLPNIRKRTIRRLQEKFPQFKSGNIGAEIARADLDVSFIEWIAGQSDAALARKNPHLYERLFTRIAAAVDESNPKPKGFDALELFDEEIRSQQAKLAQIIAEVEELQKQLLGLKHLERFAMNGSFSRLDPRVMKSVSVSAQRSRDLRQDRAIDRRKRDESSSSDDGFSVLDAGFSRSFSLRGARAGSMLKMSSEVEAANLEEPELKRASSSPDRMRTRMFQVRATSRN